MDACAERPVMVMRMESQPASTGPAADCTCPAGPGMMCWPKQISGFGTRPTRSSAIMSFAPSEVSSAGWKSARKVPDHASRSASRMEQAPNKPVTCMSWPHACMFPFVEAYAAPEASAIGSASKSARTRMVGPSPLRKTATMPCPPMPPIISQSNASRRSRIRPAVRSSSWESSGLRWRSS